MKKSLLDRMIDRPYRLADTITMIVLFVLVIVMMANLDALVDKILHPEISYFDKEHIIIGLTISAVSAILFGALLVYSLKMSATLTRERDAEATRRQSEAKYRELFRDSIDTVFMLNRRGDFLEINAAGVELLGHSDENELRTVNLETDLAIEREEAGRFFHEIEKYGFVKDFNLALKRNDGKDLLVNINAKVARDRDGNIDGYRGVMRDITSKDYLERQMVNAQRMESISHLAKGIAHQFNDVITTIEGYAELAAIDVGQDSSAYASLAEVVNAAKRAERLSRELTVFSRQQQLTPVPQNINQLVEASVSMIGHLTKGAIEFSTTLLANPAISSVDAASIENSLLNLVMFSRERLDNSGEIKLITGNANIDKDEYLTHHPDAHKGQFVTIAVEDNGPMIAADKLHRIFEPFTSVEGRDDSGLEMSVVYGAVIQHDGWIDIESTPSHTRITIYLPVSAALVEDGEDICHEITALKGRGQRLLVVEDEETVRLMAEKMLSANGYEVFAARDANDAFRIFAREKGDIDVVFTDVVMPGESGISLAEHLTEYKARMPIILTSGHETTVDEWRSIQDRGYYFIPKPYSLTRLLQEIGKAFSEN